MASYIMAHTAPNRVLPCTPNLPVIHRFFFGACFAPPVSAPLECRPRRRSSVGGDGHRKPR
jgi:hypothetical protein